jgi:hypothetical protein
MMRFFEKLQSNAEVYVIGSYNTRRRNRLSMMITIGTQILNEEELCGSVQRKEVEKEREK